ncbi:MAG: type II secretion system GspH family protein [Pseudomonadales bacterium]|nr:type II secretion system GspH family protein [Pseudomonadales bacterium]
MFARSKSADGFTLIELLMVIVIASILGVGVVQFIVHSMQGVLDTAGRQQMAVTGALLAERITREMREALPNSVRVFSMNGATDNCVEWIPIIGAANYIDEVGSGAVTDWQVMVPEANESVSGYVAVYPIMVEALYPNGVNQAITPAVITFPAGALATVDLSGQTFPADSPNRRYFVVTEPESLCFISGYLYRYSSYGFDLNVGSSQISGVRQTVAGGIGSGLFDFLPSSLVRNAVLSMQISMVSSTEESVSINQQVQVRNVP